MSEITYDSTITDYAIDVEKNTAYIEIETAKYVDNKIVDCVIHNATILINDFIKKHDGNIDDIYEYFLDEVYTLKEWEQYSRNCTDQEHRFTNTSGAYEHIEIECSAFC